MDGGIPRADYDRHWQGGPPTGEMRQRIVADFLPLVRAVARKIRSRLPPSVDLDDLVSAGTVGLIDAVDRYVPMEIGDFRRYAAIRIRGAILDELRALDWAPRSARQARAELEEMERAVAGQLGRKATEDDLAAALAISVEELRTLRSRLVPKLLLHIEDLGRRREEGRTAWEILPDTEAEDPAALAALRNAHAAVTAAVAALTERERQVISLFYFEQFMAKDIARIFGVTEGRISQIHHAALERIRKKVTTLPFRN
ncbi:MAG: FliA/WhiG family RNA polymerase sigma factor [Deltaproteobacteria bacterium]|nr:FliA/WhiG family RNA polymerase sigma factor [Deltaproteobacteria bacterium]